MIKIYSGHNYTGFKLPGLVRYIYGEYTGITKIDYFLCKEVARAAQTRAPHVAPSFFYQDS